MSLGLHNSEQERHLQYLIEDACDCYDEDNLCSEGHCQDCDPCECDDYPTPPDCDHKYVKPLTLWEQAPRCMKCGTFFGGGDE